MKKQVFLFTAILGMTLIGCQSQENLVSLADEANVVTSIPRSQLKKLKTIKEQKATPTVADYTKNTTYGTPNGGSQKVYTPTVSCVTGEKGMAKNISVVTLAPIPGVTLNLDLTGSRTLNRPQQQVSQVEVDAAADRIFVSLRTDTVPHYYIFKNDGSFVAEFASEISETALTPVTMVVDREYHQLVLTQDDKVAVYDYDGHLQSLTPMRYAATSARRLGDYWFCCPAGSDAWQYQEYPVISSKKLTDKQKQLLLGDDAGRNTDYCYPLYKDSTMNKPADIVHCGFLTDANFTPVSKIMHTYAKSYKSRSTGLSQQFQNINEDLFFYPIEEANLGGDSVQNEIVQIVDVEETHHDDKMSTQTRYKGMQEVNEGKNLTYYKSFGSTVTADLIMDACDANECYCAGSSPNGGVYYYDNGTFWQMHPTYAVPVLDLQRKRFLSSFKMSDRFLLGYFNNTHKGTLTSRSTGKEYMLSVPSKDGFENIALLSTANLGDASVKVKGGNVTFKGMGNYSIVSPLDITLDGKLVFAADPLTIKKKAMEQYDGWSEYDKQRLHDIDPKGSITLIFVTPKPESEWK